MNILIASVRGPTNADRRGGAQDYIHYISRPWVEDGHRVTIVCAQQRFQGSLLPAEETVDGIEIRRVGSESRRFRSLRTELGKCYLDYDIVIENLMGFPLFLPRVIRRVPLIALKHHFEGMTFLRTQGFLKGLFGLFLEDVLLPLFYRKTPFVVVSTRTRDALYARWLSPAAPVTIIPPGIPPLDIDPDVEKNSAPTVIYYGTLDIGRKRVDHLLQAFTDMLQEVPDARLVIGGDGPDRARLEQQAADMPVEFRGFLSEAEKCDLLARGWVFASPSMTEGFGITWVEANSAGLPVVGYDLGLDTVDKHCAAMVPVGDVAALAAALGNILTDSELRQEMAEAARKNAARFDWTESSRVFMKFMLGTIDDFPH